MALLTLNEAKQQLNMTGTSNDVELQAYIDSLTPVIERFVGPVENREVVETVDAAGLTLCLSSTPVVSLTSIVAVLDGGTTVDIGAVAVEAASGAVRRRDGGRWWGGPWTATYTAGRGSVPPTINLAARMLLQHLWRTQNASRGPVIAGGDDFSVGEPVPGFGYAVPNRVLQLLEPYRLPIEVG